MTGTGGCAAVMMKIAITVAGSEALRTVNIHAKGLGRDIISIFSLQYIR